jgi:hypothetical protein
MATTSGNFLAEVIELFGGKQYDYSFEVLVTLGVIIFSLIVIVIFYVFLDENLSLKPQFGGTKQPPPPKKKN